MSAPGLSHEYAEVPGAGHRLATLYERAGERLLDFHGRALAP